METNTIIQGDALLGLKSLPDESVNCVVTSPPYWALRDYGVSGQLGLEPTFQEYITKLCDIFDEAKRVLRKDGTCWVNMGDTYGSGKGEKGTGINGYANSDKVIEHKKGVLGYEKSLLQIPSRFAIEMTNRGWILRNEIIWFKPNCMPSSVKDRFTVDFEKVFFFVKNKKYWFDTQYEEATYTDNRKDKGTIIYDNRNTKCGVSVTGQRNKRCVWRVTTKPFKEAHFATYPESLIEPMIQSGCPEFVCKKCCKPREKVYEPTGNYIGQGGYGSKTAEHIGVSPTSSLLTKQVQEKKYTGMTTCSCNAEFVGGTVLDPFFGAGTTGVVAKKQGKTYVGIEINTEYIAIAQSRIAGTPKTLL
jgi:DNA modification methylase